MSDRLHDDLVHARKLLASPARWTQGKLARDPHGAPCEPTLDAAACWCIEGALIHAISRHSIYGRHRLEHLEELESLLRPHMGDATHVHKWNDATGRTHAQVLAVFDAAIGERESDEVSP